MNPTRLIASRYLRSRHTYGFISFIGLLGMIGLAIGVAALILTLSVMDGFEEVVADKLASIDGHLRLSNALRDDQALPDSILQRLAEDDRLVSVTPFLAQHALVRKGQASDGVLLMGADLNLLAQAINVKQFLVEGAYPDAGSGGSPIILGAKLARNLGAGVGDEVILFDLGLLVASQGLRGRAFEIAAIYRSGMVEYDQLLAFASLTDAQALFGRENGPSQAVINLRDKDLADAMAEELEVSLGFPYYLLSWRARHASLFRWLTGQQTPVLVIFGLIALVALVNILSTLIMVAVEKYRDIGVLRSLGFSQKQVRQIFFYQGMMVGIVGALGGLVLAWGLGTAQRRYGLISLDADIYFMDALPVLWSWESLVGIPGTAFLATVAISLWPSHRAAATLPGEALRYE